MSIQGEINRINDNISDSYDAAQAKGASMPDVQNSDNLPGAIASIPSAGSPSVYSEHEMPTGEIWLDGRPIYRKVYSFENVYDSLSIPMNVSDFGEAVKLYGMTLVEYRAYPSNNQVLQRNPIPYYGQGMGVWAEVYVENSVMGIGIEVASEIRLYTESIGDPFSGWIALEYVTASGEPGDPPPVDTSLAERLG